MNNEELRLRNLVKQKDVLKKVYHITNVTLGHDDYEPVPITDDLLIRSGFKVLQHDMKSFSMKISRGDCNSFFIRIWFNKRWVFGIYGHDGGVEIPVEYYHQVQNLYFDLAGQQLKLY